MSIFDSVTPKKNLSEPFSGGFSGHSSSSLESNLESNIVVGGKERETTDIELALQKISPVESPFATAVLQTELRKLREVS